MKTDNLIAALAADAPGVAKPIGRTLLLAAAVGAVGAAALFYYGVGFRLDIATAVATPRFLFKWLLALTLVVSALGLVLHVARPGSVPATWLMALAIAPALLIMAMIGELLLVPSAEWKDRLMGVNATVCVVLIPILSAAPLVALIWALRQGAPTRPMLAGAVAGLVAAGIGAFLYASHCRDDSPLFIAAWYVLGTAIVAAMGALLGWRYLRW
jgi:hypothetical protein